MKIKGLIPEHLPESAKKSAEAIENKLLAHSGVGQRLSNLPTVW
jgi:uncharacterized membrane protein YheB (UPF0754 family)